MKKLKYKAKKNKELDKIIKDLEKDLAVTLIAETPDAIVNGYVNATNDGEDYIIEVVLYSYNEAPTYHEFVYQGRIIERGRKSTLQKVPNYDDIQETDAIISVI